MRLLRTFIVLFLCISSLNIYAQIIPSKNITINDGLPSNTIRCIYKDSRELLWIGTDAGLCCYDGINYKVFPEINGLKHNGVWSIVEDLEHNLWLSIYGLGIAKYDGKKFHYFDTKDGLLSNYVRKLVYANENKCLIMATENGVCLFDGKKFKSFKNKDEKFKFQITGINKYNNQFIITSSRHGVYKLDLKEDIQNSNFDSLFCDKISYSAFIDSTIYYAGDSKRSLVIRNLKTNEAVFIPCPIIWDYVKDKKNHLYFACSNINSPEGGLFKYSKNGLVNINVLAKIKSNDLWCLFYDKKSDVLWVGSGDMGLYKIDLSDNSYFLSPDFFHLQDLQIQTLFNDNYNNTWIGGKNYIIKLKPDYSFDIINKELLWKKIKFYYLNKGIKPNTDNVFEQRKITEGFTSFNITNDRDGYIWISTTWGLICLNDKMDMVWFYGSDGGYIGFDGKDRLFFSNMYAGPYAISNKFNVNTIIKYSLKNENTPRNIRKIVSIKGNLWLASITNGLYKWENENLYCINSISNFKENNIRDLIVDSQNHLVIGTNNGKVYITKPKGDSLVVENVYQTQKELIGTCILFIDELQGYYIVGTNKGINFLKQGKLVKFLNHEKGFNDLQFNDCVKTKNGDLFIASNNGLINIKKDFLLSKVEPNSNSININAIKVNGNNHLPFDTLISWNSFISNKIELNYNQNEIEILFSNNNSFNADKNTYRYKIEGLSDNWSDYESVGKIQLRAIPNGKYHIIIEGKNTGTGEIFKTKTLELIITPPFWKANWFILFSIILIIVLLYWFYKIRINNIKLKAELHNKLLETRLEALRAQMNPHFMFNAINSIQNFIIDNNISQALHYLGEFSKLIRQTLENATEKLMPLATEISFLNSYIAIQKMRFENISTSLIVNNTIDKYNIQIPPLIIQPFIENAFEHAFENTVKSERVIEINFKTNSQLLICTIKDNGKGFKKGDNHSLHQSKGHQLTIDRLNLLNNEYKTNAFKVEVINLNTINKTQTGTEITITFLLIDNSK